MANSNLESAPAPPLKENSVPSPPTTNNKKMLKREYTQITAILGTEKTAKKHLAQQLAALGITLKGHEFRGAARALSTYVPLAESRSTVNNGPPPDYSLEP